jgi:hypothetical protein
MCSIAKGHPTQTSDRHIKMVVRCRVFENIHSLIGTRYGTRGLHYIWITTRAHVLIDKCHQSDTTYCAEFLLLSRSISYAAHYIKSVKDNKNIHTYIVLDMLSLYFYLLFYFTSYSTVIRLESDLTHKQTTCYKTHKNRNDIHLA